MMRYGFNAVKLYGYLFNIYNVKYQSYIDDDQRFCFRRFFKSREKYKDKCDKILRNKTYQFYKVYVKRYQRRFYGGGIV